MIPTHFIQCSAVKVAERRWRREFPEASHQELITSICGPAGLMHAIVLRLEGDGYTLVAGERRLRAVREIHQLGYQFTYGGIKVPAGSIPYVSLGELPYLEAREAELEENIRRLEQTWQERSAASAELLSLREAQATAAGLPIPLAREVAQAVTDTPNQASTVVQEILLAPYLNDPDIAGASSVKEGFRILKRKEEAAKNERLAIAVGRTFTASVHELHNGDCVEWLRACPAETFDVILTDPPYGMGADEFGDSGVESTRKHAYSDFLDNWRTLMNATLSQLARVAKPEAHAYLFCDIDNFTEMRYWMKEWGWTPFRTPLIWYKPQGFRAPWPEHGPRRQYECVLFAMKGGRRVTKLLGDVLTYPLDESLGHAAQKPVALFADLLSRSARPGDTVLDPFAGTGTIFPAAHALKCKAVGVERDLAFYGIAAGRLKELSG